MSKPASSGIPGVDAMTDTFDFFKNMWSGMPGMNLPGLKSIPGMVMPTLSTDEINKQITDLRAVESWLSLNLNMLQGTIQALEVQKATISTLQTMGESFTAAMQPPQQTTDAPGKKSPFESPFSQPASARKEEAPPAAAEKKAAASEAPGAEGAMPPMANPAAWWGMLQDQFKQAVNTATALTPESGAAPAEAPSAKPAESSAPRKRKAAPKE